MNARPIDFAQVLSMDRPKPIEPAAAIWSAEAEQAVLGGLMLFPEASAPIRAIGLGRDDFHDEAHRAIWRAIAAVQAQGAEPNTVSVLEALRSAQADALAGGLEYLERLCNSAVSAKHSAALAAIVSDKAHRRRLHDTGKAIQQAAGGPLDAAELRGRMEALSDDLLRYGAPTSTGQRFKLLTPSDLQALPPLDWRVRGVLPAGGVAALFGPSGSGKSFLSLDLAAHIAEGREWFGHRVKPAPTVYLGLEGEAGFRQRAEAWEKSTGRKLPASLRLVLQGFKLVGDVPDLAAAILAEVGEGATVFVDTLNRAAPLADENSSRDMGEILEGAKALQRLTAGLVVLLHHTGKDSGRGLRGHSSLFAAMDAAIEVTREGDRREWKVSKSKDGEDGAAFPFLLQVVDLAPDDEGDPVTSCVVWADESPREATRSRAPKGGNQRVVLDALGELLRKSSDRGKGSAPLQRQCVAVEAAVEAIAPHLMCEPLRQKERTRLALTGLVSAGVVTSRDGWLWLP